MTSYTTRGKTRVHRLFFVEHDRFSHDDTFKILPDLQSMSKIKQALHRLDPGKAECFGIYGDEDALKNHLLRLFPSAHSDIIQCFGDDHSMPTLYFIHDHQRLVFVLIYSNASSSRHAEKSWYFTIILQQYLRDITSTILICPSEEFFIHFTDKHSFHGRPPRQEEYRQVKTTLTDRPPVRPIAIDGYDDVKSRLSDQCRHVLISDVSPHTFCLHRTSQDNHPTMTMKLQQLRESLERKTDVGIVTLRNILDICQEHQIQLSPNQKEKINQSIDDHFKRYRRAYSDAESNAKSVIRTLLGDTRPLGIRWSSAIDVSQDQRDQFYHTTTQWLIRPDETRTPADTFLSHIIQDLNRTKDKEEASIHLSDDQRNDLVDQLRKFDAKERIRQLQQEFIHSILLIIPSENQWEMYYNLDQLSYFPCTQQSVAHVSMKCQQRNEISFTSLAQALQISDLSSSDRQLFAREMGFVGCFKSSDGTADILVLRRPNVKDRTITAQFGHSILSLKKNHVRKISDFALSNVHVAYACHGRSQTLILYNMDTGAVIRCVLDSFGQKESSNTIRMQNAARKPRRIKSMALTVSQDRLILIDDESKVYSMDVSKRDATSIDRCAKSNDGTNYESTFVNDKGEPYECVQTIGEGSAIFFFFQSASSVDILDGNFHQIQRILLKEPGSPYRMQMFRDSVTAYCVLFNGRQYEAYTIDNLMMGTRLERQETSTDAESLKREYVGNRLLDVIKRGELHFGPASYDQKTCYWMILPSHRTGYYDRIHRYFHSLSVSADLITTDVATAVFLPSLDFHRITQVIATRVPLHLCTMDNGILIPLSDVRYRHIDHSLPIIGIIGRQSTGKSYLLNRLFGTRFAVGGRFTDGIWMSYAYSDGQEYLVLDCEGLFNDQRTEDEEVKLIAFLATMCDVTILSQDLGFSRYQDRLFDYLSKAMEKIEKTEKLFKGRLLVAVRDVSDSNGNEVLDATEKKFVGLQQKGQMSFLEKLFSNVFNVQPLHHLENVNFDYDIVQMRKSIINATKNEKRWKNGKEISDQMTILLLQLHGDGLTNSNEKFLQMKTLWIDLGGEDVGEQEIEKVFRDRQLKLTINHQDLKFDEASLENDLEDYYNILLHSAGVSVHSDTARDLRVLFVNEIIPEMFEYRCKLLKQAVMRRF